MGKPRKEVPYGINRDSTLGQRFSGTNPPNHVANAETGAHQLRCAAELWIVAGPGG